VDPDLSHEMDSNARRVLPEITFEESITARTAVKIRFGSADGVQLGPPQHQHRVIKRRIRQRQAGCLQAIFVSKRHIGSRARSACRLG
jgi:hypothetical protein